MKVDDTYRFLLVKANNAAYLYSKNYVKVAYVDWAAGKLIDQIRKHLENHGLEILQLPSA